MAEISSGMVKEVRERSGAGMMDCKNALVEAAGDVEKALEIIQKKGLAKAVKKAGRVASEGAPASAVRAAGSARRSGSNAPRASGRPRR